MAVDSNIGSLPAAASIEDDSLLVAEQQGEAKHFTGKLLKDYAVAAAKKEADRAEAAAVRQPIIQNGTWWLWDFEQGVYVDSGVAAQGKADMRNYLPLAGGDMKGPIKVVQGATGGLDLGDAGLIGQRLTDRWNTFLGLYNGECLVAHAKYPTRIRGSLGRPTYNGNDMALLADIPDSDVFIAVYGETTFEELTEAYNAGKFLVVEYGATYSPLSSVHAGGGFVFRSVFSAYDGADEWAYIAGHTCSSTSGWTYASKDLALSDDVPSTTEQWTFALEDGSTVTKKVYVG